mgnify:CR=1 FL=1
MRVSRSGTSSSVTRHQPLLQAGNLAGGAVAGHHDLLVAVEQRVEGVEELLLDALLAAEELHVVDQQHVHAAVLLAELHQRVVRQRVDVLVGEFLGRHVRDARAGLEPRIVADGVHEVRLAEAHAAVHEQRVVGAGRGLRHRERRRVREVVGRTDHEGLKRVTRIQPRLAPGRLRRVTRGGMAGRLRSGRRCGSRRARCGCGGRTIPGGKSRDDHADLQ